MSGDPNEAPDPDPGPGRWPTSDDDLDASRFRHREPWAVSFGPFAAIVGSFLAAGIFMVLTFGLLSLTPPETFAETGESLGRITTQVGGPPALLLLLSGPLLGPLVAWLLRRIPNQSVHVVVFALVGAVLGTVIGFVFGSDLGAEMATLLGPMMGTSVGLARMALSPFART